MIFSLSVRGRRTFASPTRRRCAWLALGLSATLGAAPAHADTFTYLINQRYGSIGFSVSQLGLFSIACRFMRFTGRLAIDAEHPARSRIDVTINTGFIWTASPQAVSMLRSPAYFDVARYPAIHFVSRSITEIVADRFIIRGLLTIRGVTHRQSLAATLRHEKDASAAGDIADFKVTGSLQRSAYGMTANENFVGDKVELLIFIRLHLSAPLHGG